MEIATDSYEVIHKRYSETIVWMSSLGIKLSTGRTAHYERVIRHWKTAYKTASPDEAKEVFVDFVSSLFEVQDLISIYLAFKNIPLDQLTGIIEKLKKAVNGPIFASEEKPKSTTARNFLFEGTVAARLHQPEKNMLTILNSISDTGVKFNNKKIWVECKRVTNIDKIEANTRKASTQLERVLKQKIGSGHRGIVALDVSKIFHSGDQILVKKDDAELLSTIDYLMDQFISTHSDLWESVYARRDRKIIGTIIRFSFMCSSEERNLLVQTSQWAINPRHAVSHADEQLQRDLVTAIKSGQ
ncbi:MAG: hypothetical protein P1U32_09560 [Legionellaceae bacterium]|jgi:hypothetical protein|nr:hypothetical protein [Legionellaceae bacterium]